MRSKSKLTTFISILRECRDRGAVEQGREIHAEICICGALRGDGDGDGGHDDDEDDDVLGNTLLDMYARSGELSEALYVFRKLPVKNAVSFNTLITGYTKCSRGEDALQCFGSMQSEGIQPSTVSYACTLKACGMLGSSEKGQQLHSHVCIEGLEMDIFVGNSLVSMYTGCGLLVDAQAVFDRLRVRDIVSWNSLIGGYADYGHCMDALECFGKLRGDGFIPDSVSYLCALKACRDMATSSNAVEIHMEIFKRALDHDVSVGSTLVDVYVDHGSFIEACQVFEKLPRRNIVTWNVMIAGYVKHELGEEAVNCFGRMQVAGVQPNRATFILMLKASICIGSVDKGMEMHGEVARRGFQGDLLLGSALVDMYAASRMLIKAREVFESLPMKSIVSWTSLIAGYAEHGFGAEALECFESMQSHGVSPNNVTLICGLKASGNIGSIEKVKEFHGTISKCGWLERDPVVGNALIDAYTKCGSLSTAQRVFDRLPIKDEVSWNALLMGYVNHGNYEEVLELFFKRMQSENVIPSSITFSCCLKACGTLGAINKGQALHDCIAASGLLEADPFLANALIEMYTKCGFLVKAQEVFDNLAFRDCLVSWNALIAGYGDRGDCDKVLSLFDDMVTKEGVRPDMVTFLGVLGACKHSGLVDKGCLYMRAMYDIHGITPMLEHYACLVDLLHRAGQLDMVTAAIENLPFQPNRVLWHTILSAGRQWGRVELGEKGFEHAMELDATDDAAHVCLSNMYAELQMHDEAIEIQAMRVRKAGLV